MDAKELRQKSPVELKALVAELTVKLRALRFGAAQGQGKKVAELRTARRDLARAKLVLSEAATK